VDRMPPASLFSSLRKTKASRQRTGPVVIRIPRPPWPRRASSIRSVAGPTALTLVMLASGAASTPILDVHGPANVDKTTTTTTSSTAIGYREPVPVEVPPAKSRSASASSAPMPQGWVEQAGTTTSPFVSRALPALTGGIPDVVLRAYRAAAGTINQADPTCHLDWSVLAGIGRVESNHAQFGGSRPQPDGSVQPPILGIALDGRPGVARIGDTDGGRFDRDAHFDRAVGPMQFIPGTWAGFGRDGDGNGTADPQNVFDAALSAATYLCAGPGDLSKPDDLRRAILRYNNSSSYADLVLRLAAAYASGTALPGPAPQLVQPPLVPPATPSQPAAPNDPPAVETPPATTEPPTTEPPTTTAPPTTEPPATEPPTTTAPPTTEPPTTEPPTTEPTTQPPTTAPDPESPTCTPAAAPTDQPSSSATDPSSSSTTEPPACESAPSSPTGTPTSPE
jgi:membrane-bound lytic murein transglycosylase B